MAKKYIESESTHQPEGQLQYAGRKRLKDDQWKDLAANCLNGVDAALAGRETLDENLGEWSDLYEMLTEETDWPWPKAANIRTPLIASELEALVAYIAGQVLVPRLFLVTGLTDAAAATAHQVERYYNAELKRQRGDSTWFEELVDWLHLGTRDGTGYLEVLWKYKKTKLRVVQLQQRMEQGPDGQPAPVMGPDGLPVVDRTEQFVDDIHNDVEVTTRELRDVMTVPAEATSINDAPAVIVTEYLYEDRLMEMVKDGLLDAEEVEMALRNVPAGTTELASSEQPLNTFTAGDNLSIGIGQGTQTTKFFANRGPLEIKRMHTKQYDLDKDGTPEENVVWLHKPTRRMLGWTRYEYFNNLGGTRAIRPLFPFSPFARPGRLLGFSLVGRLAGLQNERDSIRNQRLNENDLRLSPPWIGRKGSLLEDQKFAWGPRNTWWTEDPFKDFTRVELPPIPQSAYAEESAIVQDAKEYTGLANPMMGMQSTGKRSAQEARMWQAAAMTRTGLLAMRYRMAIRPVINFIHALKKQYLTDNQSFVDSQGNFTLPLPVLSQDYQIDVAGASDPLDASQRRTETANAYEMLSQSPVVQQQPGGLYYLTRKLGETLDWGPELDKIIGTEEQYLQRLKAQAAAAQAAQQGGQPGAQPGGQPQPGAPPQGNPPQ